MIVNITAELTKASDLNYLVAWIANGAKFQVLCDKSPVPVDITLTGFSYGKS